MESNYFKKAKPISIKDALLYEIQSHWLASKVSNPFLQNLLAKYFAWKVGRKYKKYQYRMLMKDVVYSNNN